MTNFRVVFWGSPIWRNPQIWGMPGRRKEIILSHPPRLERGSFAELLGLAYVVTKGISLMKPVELRTIYIYIIYILYILYIIYYIYIYYNIIYMDNILTPWVKMRPGSGAICSSNRGPCKARNRQIDSME